MKKIFIGILLGIGIFSRFDFVYADATPQDITCPWSCGSRTFQVSEDVCSGDFFQHMSDQIGTGCTYGISVYCLGSEVATTGNFKYKNTMTGIGWTAYWRSLINYCTQKGLWTDVNENPAVSYGTYSNITFTITEKPEYSGNLIQATSDKIIISGTKKEIEKRIISPSFNSPNIYLENAPEGKIYLEIKSDWGTYENQKPNFNLKNGWEVEVKNEELRVKNEAVDHLFYELGLKKVELNRNGRNFESQESLVAFLENSEFFARLGFNETEKANSLGYILPKIQEQNTPYYYLTILSDKGINEISELDITPMPEKLVRKYFAIYPSQVQIRTSGDLIYPAVSAETDAYTIKEYGEILVTPEMYVFWEELNK